MVIISQLTTCPDSFPDLMKTKNEVDLSNTQNLAQNSNKHAWCFSHINCKDEFWLKNAFFDTPA